jgi:hypothetical protein
MNMSDVLLAIALISALWGVVTTVLIAVALHRRGFETSMLFLRVMILKYLGQYREVTRAETGRTGPLFYSYIIAMNLALVTGVAGLVLRGS